MKTIIKAVCSALERGRRVAVAVIVRQDGSAPRGPGARLAADEKGLLCGTVGGGLAEARVLEWCAAALREGTSRILSVDMDGHLDAGADMICGGRVVVLVEPLSPADLPLFRAMAAALTPSRDAAGQRAAGGTLYVSLASFARTFVDAQGGVVGAPLPPHMPSPQGDHAVIVSVDGADWFIDPILPPWRLILAGGGHVSRPTAHMATLVDYAVTVLDDRPEFATPERFPDAEQTFTVPEFADCLAPLAPDARTSVVILTRGHVHDATVLAQALRTEAGYIGMIGSTRKRNQVYASLLEAGFTQDDLQRVHCPVGLRINAQTPEEIAVSIVGELIAARRS